MDVEVREILDTLPVSTSGYLYPFEYKDDEITIKVTPPTDNSPLNITITILES